MRRLQGPLFGEPGHGDYTLRQLRPDLTTVPGSPHMAGCTEQVDLSPDRSLVANMADPYCSNHRRLHFYDRRTGERLPGYSEVPAVSTRHGGTDLATLSWLSARSVVVVRGFYRKGETKVVAIDPVTHVKRRRRLPGAFVDTSRVGRRQLILTRRGRTLRLFVLDPALHGHATRVTGTPDRYSALQRNRLLLFDAATGRSVVYVIHPRSGRAVAHPFDSGGASTTWLRTTARHLPIALSLEYGVPGRLIFLDPHTFAPERVVDLRGRNTGFTGTGDGFVTDDLQRYDAAGHRVWDSDAVPGSRFPLTIGDRVIIPPEACRGHTTTVLDARTGKVVGHSRAGNYMTPTFGERYHLNAHGYSDCE